jgi:hypothetical protein
MPGAAARAWHATSSGVGHKTDATLMARDAGISSSIGFLCSGRPRGLQPDRSRQQVSIAAALSRKMRAAVEWLQFVENDRCKFLKDA